MGERLSWDDRLNAVTVKELRQSLCGSRKTLFSGLMVMVLLLVSLTGLFFYAEMLERGEWDSDMGLTMIEVTLGAVVLMALLGGLGVMLRLNREVKIPDLNMANFTSLTPWQMVRGRLLAALALMGYVCSLSLPVMAVMYQMRGVELSQVAYLWLHAVVFMLMVVSLMQLLASYGNLVLAGLMGFVFGGYALLGMIVALAAQQDFSLTSFSLLSLTLLTLMLLLTGLFLVSTVAHLSPEHANGMLWQKSYCLLMLVVLFVYLLVLARQGGLAEEMKNSPVSQSLWLTALAAELVLLLLACLPITWRQEASLRIREHCPEGLLGRLGYYLVSNIWGGSYLLAFLLLAIVSAVSLGCQWKEMIKLFPFLPLLNTIGYVLFYAALIQCLHRRFGAVPLQRLGCYVFGGLGVVPVVLYCIVLLFFGIVNGGQGLDGDTARTLWQILTVTTPLGGLNQFLDSPEPHTRYAWLFGLLGLCWAVVGLLMVGRTIWRQFRAFRKPTEAEWRELIEPQEPGGEGSEGAVAP